MAPLGKLLTQSGTMHHIYADDVLIYFVHDGKETVSDSSYQTVLDSVADWMVASHLAINASKTQALVFHYGRESNITLPQLHLMGEQVNICTEGVMKYLGVNLDTRLNLSKHIATVCRSAFTQLRTIRRVRSSLNVLTAKMLCNSLIMSRLDYCSPLLIGSNKQDLEKIQRVVNATARVIFNLQRTSSISTHLKELRWIPVEQRYIVRTACLVHKIMSSGRPEYLEVDRYQPARELRSGSQNLLVIANGRKKAGMHIFKVLSSKVWNDLPSDLREEKKLGIFASKLLKHMEWRLNA
jgi:hypothetical protein